MLTPTLYIEDLRDRPTFLRITDVTEGYGLNGNPTRAQVTSATLRIEKWVSPTSPNTIVWDGTLPPEFINEKKSVEIPYPPGSAISGDGMIVVFLCLYSTVGIPVSKSTYTANLPVALATGQRLVVERDGAWALVATDKTFVGMLTYVEQATSHKLTRWRVENADSTVAQTGSFTATDTYSSPIQVSSSSEAKLISQSGHQVFLLGRTRRLLNQISEKLVTEDRVPTTTVLGEALTWLRVYEQMGELGLSDYGTASPLRSLVVLADLQRTLNTLWLRNG